MTRDLCVELTDVRDGLGREVYVDIEFMANGYSRQSKLLSKE